MKKVFFSCVFFVFVLNASAQANKKDVRVMLEVSGLTDKYQTVIDQFSEQLPEDTRAKFKKDVQVFIDKQITSEVDKYAAAFSQAEILKLIDFYKSPLGIKLLKESNEINNTMLIEIDANQSELQGILMKYFM